MSQDKNNDTDPEDMIRKRVRVGQDQFYLAIGDKSLMASFPRESAYEGKELKSMLNFAARMVSKAMSGKKLTWADVADQAERSGVGHKCLTDDIAKIIREYHKC